MRAWRSMSLVLVALVAGALADRASPQAGAPPSPRVTLSSSGMEGLGEVKVQAHLAGGADWRELVELDETKLEKRVEDLLEGTAGLTLVEGEGSVQTPRVLVIAVGHLIADPEGNKDTAATNLSVSLNQPVSVRRQVPSGRPVLTTGMTWHRNLLITGLSDTMRPRVEEKLAYLMGQFVEEYARANPASRSRPAG